MAAFKENTPNNNESHVDFEIAAFNISVYSSFEAVMLQWQELEEKTPATIYQTYAWQKAWQDTIGAADNAEPLLITASIDGKIVFLLPLTLVEKSGLLTACFMGGDHANYKFALFDPNHLTEISAILPKLLEQIATLKTHSIDVFDLTRIPLKWDGFDNPLTEAFNHSPSTENGGSVSMGGDFDAVLAYGNSKRKRKILRAQERGLEALGGYEFITARNAKEGAEIYQLFVEQKQEWFAQRGIANPFDNEPTKAFFGILNKKTQNDEGQLLNYSALKADGKFLGLLAHGIFKGQSFGYFTSMSMDEKYKSISPGSFIFHKQIEECCLNGLRRFDFGVGGERYKKSWCDEQHDLVDIILPVSTKGRLYCAAVRLGRHAKQQIKDNDAVWSFVKKCRTTLLGSKKKAQ
ncbi:MAG: GNAT family N-acetyltransferase [Hyphomicrobiales bacterium]